MKISSLHIDGFGRFAERTFGPFERPVIVFLGPNEAGKSTLLEFIRRVLFGFRTARGRAPSGYNDYPPLAGGRHGGSVSIVSDAGETVTVRRFQGTGGGTVTLTSESGGALPEGELPRLLGQHSRDVFQNVFTFTLDELHSQKLLSDESVNSQIYSAGMGASRLPDALKALNNDKTGLFLKGGSKHAIHDAAHRFDQVAGSLRDVENHAADYGRLTRELKEVEADLQEASRDRHSCRKRFDHHKLLESAWEDWNDLNQAKGQLAELPAIGDFPVKGVGRLEKLEGRIDAAQREYNSAGGDVREAKAGAEATVEHEAILNKSSDIRRLERGRTSFDNSVRDLPKRKEESGKHKNSLAATLKELGPDWDEARLENFDLSLAVREDISQFQERLQEAGQKLGDSNSTLTQHETLLEESTEAESRTKRELEAAVKPIGRKSGGKVLPAVCVAAGIAVLAVGAVLGGPALFLGIAAGVALAAVAAYLFASGQPFAGADMEYGRLSRAHDDARELARQRESRVEKCKKAVEEAERSVASIQREWRQWLADRNLRETFLPETVGELRGKVELGRTQLLGLRSHRERIDAIQNDIDSYIELAASLASDFGVPFDRNDSNSVAAAADSLVEMYSSVERGVSDRTAAKADLKKAERQLKERERDLQKAREELKDLLQAGGADDAEDFRHRAEIAGRRTELKEKRDEALGRLQRLSGPGEPLETLKKQLGDTNIQAIRDQVSSAEGEIDNADAKIRNFSTKQGSIRSDLKRLTSEEESSRLRADRHRLLEDMRGHAREWVIRTVAENLLKEAQGKFERERQPGVIRHAESFFKEITEGRYQAVFSPLGSSEIHVTDSAGISKEPNQLSRGTREQLFLSLRFGLVRELGQRSERLPVILDEALVNFDPDRGLRSAVAFTELSEANQVLVFTCHPTIVELFQDAAAQSGVQEPTVVPIG